jgi:hypothetical protein
LTELKPDFKKAALVSLIRAPGFLKAGLTSGAMDELSGIAGAQLEQTVIREEREADRVGR